MWQVAVAAAVAGGSGLLAKHLLCQNQIKQDEHDEEQAPEISGVSNNPTNSPPCSPNLPETHPAPNSNGVQLAIDHGDHQQASISFICAEEEGEVDGVFRFSSSGSPLRSRKSRVLPRTKIVSEAGRREKILGRLKHASVDQRKNVGKRVSVCLKRRKTSRASRERDSACSKDHTAFGWGLGLGIIYMMSAGKAEVSKLSKAIDDTAQAVHELKSELNRQKSSHSQQPSGKVGDATYTMDCMPKSTAEQANTGTSTSNSYSINRKLIGHSADSDYASSVLTVEHQAEGAEMDQLEAELESELQKLPWCTNETSEHAGNMTNADEVEIRESMSQSLVAFQSGGVSPAELRKKLSDVLIKQQENHIVELESELNLAYSQLKEKEAELQALKDCVKRLTEFSLSTVSDEETEACAAPEENVELDSDQNMGSQTAVVGMKRSMAFGMCDY